MGDRKKVMKAIAAAISWSALFAAVTTGCELIRYGKVIPGSLNFFIGPAVGFLGGFVGIRWGKARM
ncbi:hypothetical protein [Streptomyces fagopyri]|uniref:hypothetical protein n=1 Tax=Streptomyces fagopyri TaxID=2662397 RepID=UPI003404C2F5